MRFDDLEKIIHLAHSQNIHVSANALHTTVGALSKTLKKIENQLNTSLFDRVGRNIQLNAQGKKFISYALNLSHEYEQMSSEFTGVHKKTYLKISGPAVLLNVGLNAIMPNLPEKNIELSIDALYEGDAIKSLLNGQSHLVIVTNEALSDTNTFGLESIFLGTTTGTIVAAYNHPLFNLFPNGIVNMESLLKYPFICPKTSPFCGMERGVGSDGWLDHKYPRNIAYRSDDLNSLLSIVKQRRALAYVPDLIITDKKLRSIKVEKLNEHYQEKFSLIYKPSIADGWLNRLIHTIKV